jgi:hypothetical protein
LQRVRLSPTAAVADSPLGFSVLDSLLAMAIDPSGQRIAVGVAGSGLYLFDVGHSPALVAAMAQPAALAFDNTGSRLYAIDVETRRIFEFASGSGPVEFAPLGDAASPDWNAVGLAVSGDGRYLVLADVGASAIRVFDIASRRVVNIISLGAVPTRMQAVSPAPAFLLNSPGDDDPLFLLDARQLPFVYFVPANREESL